MNNQNKNTNSRGFSLVELLISIAVIGILISIIAVSYVGVARRAAGESLKSDLMAASSTLTKFKADRGVYPTTIRCDIPDSATNACLKKSSDEIEYFYNVNTDTSPDTYGLTAVKNNDKDLSYRTASGSDPILCPIGFIVVPGSKTYNTGSFCIMKYEAKQVGVTETPISTAVGLPWTMVDQSEAVDYSKNVCSGCHLVSEAEWMTLAQNVLGVNSNWDDGAGTHQVGTGYVYPGHSDNSPAGPLEAGPDSNGYLGTEQSSGSQRRTLTLSNGEVVWDMSGNVYDWTSGQTNGRQPGVIGGGLADREWTAITADGTLPVDPSAKGTGIPGSELWNTSNKIGLIRSNYDDITLHGMVRGGTWESSTRDGILCLNFDVLPTSYGTKTGFRAAASQ